MFAQSLIPNVGGFIRTKSIQDHVSVARIENSEEMCSPAVLIGPRVFLTAAHCTPLIASNGLVKVYGPGFNKIIRVKAVTMSLITDDDFFSGDDCRTLIQSLPDGVTLTDQYLAKCWFKGGAADIALLVADQDIQSPMLSLGGIAPQNMEVISRLAEISKCGGDQGFFNRSQFKVFELNNSQVVLENFNVGSAQSNLSKCGGGSGGIYYRTLQDGSINIVGIHSASIQNAGPYTIYGKKIFLSTNLFGGTNLFATEPMDWLIHQIAKFGLQICGINLTCHPVKLK